MRSHSLNLLTANCLQQRFAIAPLQLPQTSFFNEPQRHRGHREREIAPLNLPNSDSYGALRYRTPSTPQYPFLTNHRDTEDTEKERSHPLTLPNSDRTPSTPQTAIPTERNAYALPPTSQHPFLMNHKDTKNTKEQEKRE